MQASSTPRAHIIQGKEVRLPVQIRDATTYVAQYLVPARAAQELIAYSGLEVAQPFPGRAVCALGFVKYQDGDLGRYDEVAIAFLVRPFGGEDSIVSRARELLSGRIAAFIHKLPVNQGFTLEAGRAIWAFPKFMADIQIDLAERGATCALAIGGQDVLALSIQRGVRIAGRKTRALAYTFHEGVLRRIPWEIDADRFGVSPLGAQLTLGSHPLADELRALGLPKRAFASGSLIGQRSSFFAAEPLNLRS